MVIIYGFGYCCCFVYGFGFNFGYGFGYRLGYDFGYGCSFDYGFVSRVSFTFDVVRPFTPSVAISRAGEGGSSSGGGSRVCGGRGGDRAYDEGCVGEEVGPEGGHIEDFFEGP